MKKKATILSIVSIVIIIAIIGVMQGKQPSDNYSVDDLLAPTAAADYYEDTNRLKIESGSVTVIFPLVNEVLTM